MNWTVFDGGARRSRLEQAEADIRGAEAQVAATRDRIENEVWSAYSNLNTAFRQREARDCAAAGRHPVLCGRA